MKYLNEPHKLAEDLWHIRSMSDPERIVPAVSAALVRAAIYLGPSNRVETAREQLVNGTLPKQSLLWDIEHDLSNVSGNMGTWECSHWDVDVTDWVRQSVYVTTETAPAVASVAIGTDPGNLPVLKEFCDHLTEGHLRFNMEWSKEDPYDRLECAVFIHGTKYVEPMWATSATQSELAVKDGLLTVTNGRISSLYEIRKIMREIQEEVQEAVLQNRVYLLTEREYDRKTAQTSHDITLRPTEYLYKQAHLVSALSDLALSGRNVFADWPK